MVFIGDDIIERYIIKRLKSLKEENDLLKQWIIKDTDKIKCAVCGKKIDHLSVQRILRPILWHNRSCFQYKPKKIVDIERKFGNNIVEVLKETTKKCGNIKAQCQILGVSIPYLYHIIRKYCGENYLEFMSKHSTGKRRDLYTKKSKKRKFED